MTDHCFHCQQKILDGDDYVLNQSGQQYYFCCPACLAVTEMLFSVNLESYYQKRSGIAQAATQQQYLQWDEPLASHSFVTRDEGSNKEQVKSNAHFYVEGMHCTACAWLIEKHLIRKEGITKVIIQFEQAVLRVEFDINRCKVSEVMQAVNQIGYSPYPYQADQIQQAQQNHNRQKLKNLGITALLTVQLMMLAIGIYAGDFLGISVEYLQLLSLFSLIFSIPLCFFSVKPFIQSAFIALKQKQFNMDVNISLALLGLFFGSVYAVANQQGEIYFDSMGMLAFFILLARFIESKARQQLQFKKPLLPFHVNQLVDGLQQKSMLSQVNVGDHLLIKSGETLAFDGRVVQGKSSVSEAVLTGEPIAIDKNIGDEVLAGSTNHDGQLEIEVIASVDHTRLAKIQQACEINLDQKRSVYHDKYNVIFTALIAFLSIVTYLAWLVIDANEAFYIALSVLVVSCPCALSLAKPTAMSACLFALRKQGILIRDSETLNQLTQIKHIFLDKTGTLTSGEPRLIKTKKIGTADVETMQAIAAALESYSEHPLAKAFSPYHIAVAESVSITPHQGIEGVYKGVEYRIGSPQFCRAWHQSIETLIDDRQILGICSKAEFLGWFILDDTLRPSVKKTLSQLEKHYNFTLISGDQSNQVNQISNELNIPFIKGCTSKQKQAIVDQYEQAGQPTMMVGDGLNDALSLKTSHVSATFNNASDWIKNQTDIIIMRDDFTALQKTIALSKLYKKRVWQNSIWAIAYNIIAIPIAMLGYITPLWAALGMSLSSLIVVLNARRIKPSKAD